MKDLGTFDQTQNEIVEHLKETELLLTRATSKVSGKPESAGLTLLPDLGIPHSIRRIAGGFYTGMLVKWTCSEPFVPVDTTVNVCSVGVYRISSPPESEDEWKQSLRRVSTETRKKASYVWNFDSGNHFIVLARCEGGGGLKTGDYLVLHSSAAEFKNQRNGLYPTSESWYANEVKTITSNQDGRYLRYLHGKSAERFFRQADLLINFNRNRLHYFAEQLAPGGAVDEILYAPHYGMPDYQSVAIGCQWLLQQQTSVFLTAPGEDILMIAPANEGENVTTIGAQPYILMPHGLGVSARTKLRIEYGSSGVRLNGRRYSQSDSLRNNRVFGIRGTPGSVQNAIGNIMRGCPGKILTRLRPRWSFPVSK